MSGYDYYLTWFNSMLDQGVRCEDWDELMVDEKLAWEAVADFAARKASE